MKPVWKIKDIFSVHTLVFRSLKRTHDMFLYNQWSPLEHIEKDVDNRAAIKSKTEYSHVRDLHAPHIVRKAKSDKISNGMSFCLCT